MICDTQSTSNIKEEVVQEKKSYYHCPECRSVDIQLLIEDEDLYHLYCKTCKKTKKILFKLLLLLAF